MSFNSYKMCSQNTNFCVHKLLICVHNILISAHKILFCAHKMPHLCTLNANLCLQITNLWPQNADKVLICVLKYHNTQMCPQNAYLCAQNNPFIYVQGSKVQIPKFFFQSFSSFVLFDAHDVFII